MAKNDVILLDGIIEQRVKEAFPTNRKDEVFEYFAFEQQLKDYDLSQEEIESCWVDGRDDGGIDGFFVLINGHLLRDPTSFHWPRRSAEIEVWVLTYKHHDTFLQEPINALVASIQELFDFAIDNKELKGKYPEKLLSARSVFFAAYKNLSSLRPSLAVRFVYCSRGETGSVGESVGARADQLRSISKSLFSSSKSDFTFVGAAELIELYRKTKKFSIDLPVLEYLSRGYSGYIVLASLEDYNSFVTDENGSLRRYLFDSNVRDYLGSNQVNDDIMVSLGMEDGLDFWWLNNGVTILATSAAIVGKTLQLHDIQIVNGLQTTESIYNYFRTGGRSALSRGLLVKVVVSTKVSHRDRIIRATNSQNIVDTAALRATDKVQRDIEEYLDRHDWYYERRKNYYRNIGRPIARFVTPMYLARGFVALVMKNPAAAVQLRSRFMRSDQSYEMIFSPKTPLAAWVAITDILKRIDENLDLIRPQSAGSDGFKSKWRALIGLLTVSRLIGSFDYTVDDLVKLDTSRISPDLLTPA